VVGVPLSGYLGLGAGVALKTALASSLGALTGDVVKSFFKRRMGVERGRPLPLADQLDFYAGATLFLYACPPCVKPGAEIVVTGAFVVVFLHRFTNWVAYKKGLKSVPW